MGFLLEEPGKTKRINQIKIRKAQTKSQDTARLVLAVLIYLQQQQVVFSSALLQGERDHEGGASD